MQLPDFLRTDGFYFSSHIPDDKSMIGYQRLLVRFFPDAVGIWECNIWVEKSADGTCSERHPRDYVLSSDFDRKDPDKGRFLIERCDGQMLILDDHLLESLEWTGDILILHSGYQKYNGIKFGWSSFTATADAYRKKINGFSG